MNKLQAVLKLYAPVYTAGAKARGRPVSEEDLQLADEAQKEALEYIEKEGVEKEVYFNPPTIDKDKLRITDDDNPTIASMRENEEIEVISPGVGDILSNPDELWKEE